MDQFPLELGQESWAMIQENLQAEKRLLEGEGSVTKGIVKIFQKDTMQKL